MNEEERSQFEEELDAHRVCDRGYSFYFRGDEVFVFLYRRDDQALVQWSGYLSDDPALRRKFAKEHYVPMEELFQEFQAGTAGWIELPKQAEVISDECDLPGARLGRVMNLSGIEPGNYAGVGFTYHWTNDTTRYGPVHTGCSLKTWYRLVAEQKLRPLIENKPSD